MKSIVSERGNVTFPQFMAARIYMREFVVGKALPADLAHWQPTVDAMLEGVDVGGPAYLMVDAARVRAGTPQRRPGVHIDGHWVPAIQAHSNPRPGGHIMPLVGGWESKWNAPGKAPRKEAIILASSISASRAYAGEFHGDIDEGGDCSHMDLSGLTPVRLKSSRVYAGNVTMLHESLPVNVDCFRTLVRINVPGWEPQ